MMHMLWVRRFFVQIFSSLFILSLLLLALTVSITASLSKPAKLESWLSASHLYDHFIDTAASQSEKSVSKSGDNGGGVSLNDPGIKAAARQAFSSDLIEQSVNTFINSNYDWLEGNTAAPNFSIDLSGAKKTFAQQVGLYVQTKLLSLPKCTSAQLQQLSPNTDALKLPCLPPNVNPTVEGQTAEQKLAGSQDFLGTPVITAATISPANSQSKPYYIKLAKAPHAYQLAKKVPLALGALALICALLIFFVSPLRRKGVRRIGFVLLEAGVLLIASKFVADIVLTKVEAKAFNNSNIGELQTSLSSFMGRAESALLGVTLWFGIAYAFVGLVILISIFATRNRKPKSRHTPQISSLEAPAESEDTADASTPFVTDVAPRPRPIASGPPPVKPEGPTAQKKKPKLVQL
jgi:hypothetical protein